MLEPLKAKIDKWQRLGVKTDSDGSRVVAHTPRDYPEAYLHAILAPRSRAEWTKYAMKLPPHLQELYDECNGLRLFGTTLSIYGIRAQYKRDDSAAFQPFDLRTHDNECRIVRHPLSRSQPDNRVFFGSYDWDGSGIYVVPENKRVFWCREGTAEPAVQWPNLKAFLLAEYKRINKLYDIYGYPIDEDAPTIPT